MISFAMKRQRDAERREHKPRDPLLNHHVKCGHKQVDLRRFCSGTICIYLIHEFKEPTVRALFLQIKLKRKEWNKAEKANREAARLADENDDDDDDDIEQIEWELQEGQEEEDAAESVEGEDEQEVEGVDENMVDEDDEMERPPMRNKKDSGNPRDGNGDEEGGGNEEEDGDQADAEGWEEGEEEEDDDGNDEPIQPDSASASYGMQQKRDRLQSMQNEIAALRATLCLGFCYMNTLDQDCSDML